MHHTSRSQKHLRIGLILFSVFNVVVLISSIWNHYHNSRPAYTYLGESFPPVIPDPDPARNGAPLQLPTINYALEDSARFSTAPSATRAWSISLARQWGYMRLGAHRRIFALSMFHEYHCIYLFARSLATRSGADGHIHHCMNYVRQHLLCEADRTLEEPGWEDVGSGWYMGGKTRVAGRERQCKDWSALWEIEKDNNREWEVYKKAHEEELAR
ncbi:hypothetical protein EVG20_g6487 [Dentipellis fragilis]|uniref:Heme-copper oxidase subunit III family profile domain-containing protein n=1 Tax=Dentipellis fragilis TaxID=205917 RepID=A0A4Y9YPR5_9AGAM|nr:hypothetical protein EVG20_g6487 [Dentipellis fragilis]